MPTVTCRQPFIVIQRMHDLNYRDCDWDSSEFWNSGEDWVIWQFAERTVTQARTCLLWFNGVMGVLPRRPLIMRLSQHDLERYAGWHVSVAIELSPEGTRHPRPLYDLPRLGPWPDYSTISRLGVNVKFRNYETSVLESGYYQSGTRLQISDETLPGRTVDYLTISALVRMLRGQELRQKYKWAFEFEDHPVRQARFDFFNQKLSLPCQSSYNLVDHPELKSQQTIKAEWEKLAPASTLVHCDREDGIAHVSTKSHGRSHCDACLDLSLVAGEPVPTTHCRTSTAGCEPWTDPKTGKVHATCQTCWSLGVVCTWTPTADLRVDHDWQRQIRLPARPGASANAGNLQTQQVPWRKIIEPLRASYRAGEDEGEDED